MKKIELFMDFATMKLVISTMISAWTVTTAPRTPLQNNHHRPASVSR
uniref:Uncharacterized protein n=1 Tax=Anguilla anguilla TaxID=7936 RepID=A0A0E9VK93_ANGAN